MTAPGVRQLLSDALLDLARAHADVDPPALTASLLAPLDALGWAVAGYVVEDVEEGVRTTLTAPVALAGEAVLTVPGLPVALVLRPPGDGRSLSLLLPGAHDGSLELDGVRLALRFDRRLVRPVPDDGRPVEVATTARITLGRDWAVGVALPAGLSLPEVAIGATGLAVSLHDVGIVLDSRPPGAEALLPDAGAFRGVRAAHASLRVLPQATFAGAAGLRLDVRDLLVDGEGVSCDVETFWPLDHDGTVIDPQSGLVGQLLGGRLQLALAEARVQLRRSRPRRFVVTGIARLPLLSTLLDVQIGLATGAGEEPLRQTLALASLAAGTTAIGPGTLEYAALRLDGELHEDGLAVRGELRGLSITLPPLDLDVASAEAEATQSGDTATLRVALRDVALGPLGTVAEAELVAETRGEGEAAERRVHVTCQVAWADLAGRITVPPGLPGLPGDGSAAATVRWEATPAGTRVHVELRGEVADLGGLLDPLPAAHRPAARAIRLLASVTYDDTDAFGAAPTDDDLEATLAVEAELRLPRSVRELDLPFVHLHAGDPEGWITVRLATTVEDGAVRLAVEVDEPLAVDVELPGLPQPEPPIAVALTRLSWDATAGAELAAELRVDGRLTLRPFVVDHASALARQLGRLLGDLGDEPLRGTVTAVTSLAGDQARFVLDGTLDGVEARVDVREVLGELLRGRPPVPGAAPGGRVPLGSTTVAFGLTGVGLRLGALASDDPEAEVRLRLSADVFGVRVGGYLRVSDEELAIGLDGLALPLRPPAFALSGDDVRGIGTAQAWRAAIHDRRTAAGAPGVAREEAERLLAAAWLLETAFDVRGRVRASSRPAFDDALAQVCDLLSAVGAAMHTASDVRLALEDLEFVLPFADPRDVGVRGTATLTGFGPEDPLRALEGLALQPGLTADSVYVSASATQAPIALPDLGGRYPGGALRLDRLALSYGFTDNSFGIEYAGEVRLPDRLVADATGPRGDGPWIGLPSRAELALRIGAIPIPAPIPVVPTFELQLDMRRAGAPALADAATCTPTWDGLQVSVPGVVRAALTQVSVSPLLGPLPALNVRGSGDLELGDGRTGARAVLDGLVWIAGVGSPPVPIPWLADPVVPFFDTLCVDVRLAGFGLHVQLERPFPTFSPWLLFELLGLIADPAMPIDREGALARLLRVRMTGTRLELPPAVQELFPITAELARTRELDLDLADVLTVLQRAGTVTRAAAETLADAAGDVPERLRAAGRRLAGLTAADLVGMLPPEVRKVRLHGRLAGFDARAVLLLLDGEAAADELRRRDAPAGAPPPLTPAIGSSLDPAALHGWAPATGDRTASTAGPSANLFAGSEFAGFLPGDLDALDAGPEPGASLVLGALVRVVGAQEVRFLGLVADDGRFALVSRLDVPALRLPVHGLDVALPLAVTGRLELSGRARRGRVSGHLRARGHALWRAVPGVAELELGTPADPARVELHADGRFALAAPVDARIGAARLTGRADVTETRCLVRGELRYELPGLVGLHLDVTGRIGPARDVELAGRGSLSVLGRPLADVTGRVTRTRADLRGTLETRTLQAAGTDVACQLHLEAAGSVALSRTSTAELDLEGTATLGIAGATVQGRGALRVRGTSVTTRVEGALQWQDRTWLQGAVEVGPAGIELTGRTTLDFAPTGQLGTARIAVPVVRVELGGSFRVDAAGRLASLTVTGATTIGIRFPDVAQTFPVAVDRFTAEGSFSGRVLLLTTRGVSPLRSSTLPFALPVPRIVEDHSRPPYVSISAPGQLQWDPGALLPTPKLPSLTWKDHMYELRPWKVEVDWTDQPLELLDPLPHFDVYLRWDTAAARFAVDVEAR